MEPLDAVLFWALLSVLLAGVLFGLNGFFRLFGVETTLFRVGFGASVLLVEAAVVPRPLPASATAYAAQTMVFVLLALIAVLPYREDRSSPGAVALGSILVLALFGFLQPGIVDPAFATLVVASGALGRPTGTELVGPFAGAVVPLLVLWGFWSGEIIGRNRDWGLFYADVYRRAPRALFVGSQVVTIAYVVYLLLVLGQRTTALRIGDPFYLALAGLTALLLGVYAIQRTRAEGLSFTAPRALKRSFVVVGTVFLVPVLYPALDPVTRAVALAAFLQVQIRRWRLRAARAPRG